MHSRFHPTSEPCPLGTRRSAALIGCSASESGLQLCWSVHGCVVVCSLCCVVPFTPSLPEHGLQESLSEASLCLCGWMAWWSSGHPGSLSVDQAWLWNYCCLRRQAWAGECSTGTCGVGRRWCAGPVSHLDLGVGVAGLAAADRLRLTGQGLSVAT